MMNKNPTAGQPGKNNRVGAAVLRLLAILRHNWPFKLLALFIAVAMWAMLSAQDLTVNREKTLPVKATITVSGEEALRRAGFIVMTDLTALPGVSITADVPQNVYNAVTPANYSIRIDLARIRRAGRQEVDILYTNSNTYGTVTSLSPSTVELEVEEYVTRYRIPIRMDMEGTAPEGYHVGVATLDPPMVAVSGPRSLVESIVRAEAVMDLSLLKAAPGQARNAVPFVFVDANGNPVESSLIQATSESVLLDSIMVEQTLYPKKALDLSQVGLVTGTPAEGYQISRITVTPETVYAAANGEVLNELSLIYADAALDVTGMTESVNRRLKLRRPTELAYLSQDTVTVAVEIVPVIRTRRFTDVKIAVTGLESGRKATLSVKNADVILESQQLWLEGLKKSQIVLSVDVTGLESGVYTLPLSCMVEADGPGYQAEILPVNVEVTIK